MLHVSRRVLRISSKLIYANAQVMVSFLSPKTTFAHAHFPQSSHFPPTLIEVTGSQCCEGLSETSKV